MRGKEGGVLNIDANQKTNYQQIWPVGCTLGSRRERRLSSINSKPRSYRWTVAGCQKSRRGRFRGGKGGGGEKQGERKWGR